MKNTKYFRLLLGLILGFLIYYIYKQYFLHTSFVDEEDYFLIGKYLANGTKIYSKYFTHHQPGTYIISAFLQKITRPNSIYLLVKRHRQFVALWSICWCMFLTYKYGLRAFLACVVIEIIGISYLKNMFLAESLAVYPVIFVVSQMFDKKTNLFWWGLFVSFVTSLLATTWPMAIILIAIQTWKYKDNKNDLIKMIIGLLIPWLIVLFFVDVFGFFREAIGANLKYYIPQLKNESNGLAMYVERMIGSIFVKSVDKQVVVVKSFIILLWLGLAGLLKSKKSKIGLILLIMFLIDMRIVPIEKIGFDGFRSFLWTSMIVWMSIKLSSKIGLLVAGIMIVYIAINYKNEVFAKRNLDNDYYIYYSQQLDLAEAVRIMANNDSKLLVIPDKPLIYWHSGVKPANSFVFYFKWMDKVAIFRQEMLESAKSNEADFWIYPSKNRDLPNMGEYLEENNYKRLKKDGEYVSLYVKESVLNELGEEEKSKLDFYNFEY